MKYHLQPPGKIPFNRPYMNSRELIYIEEAVRRGHISGDGHFTKLCHQWIEKQAGCPKALLTHSCTAALEMAAILAEIKPGDEVIMPSYTFVSTANAFVLRGGVPVFIDIRPDTMNMDQDLIEAAITPKTRAIVPVHYAGVACEMDQIMELAGRYGLLVIEDAAQGMLCRYKGRPLGSIGQLGAFSFHETKNIISGEGGAILINDQRYIERAEIIREKGTNRSKFFRGEIDKYSWVDYGSSFLPSDIIAAFLYAQMEEAEKITTGRVQIWHKYYEMLRPLADEGLLELPIVPEHCSHNAHMFYIKACNLEERTALIDHLKKENIYAVFHYVPLHSSMAGKKYGRFCGQDRYTTRESERLLRLPFYADLSASDIEVITANLARFFRIK